MQEVFPICAKTSDPERTLSKRDRSPTDGTIEAKAFIKATEIHNVDRSRIIQEVRPGVIRRTKRVG